MPDRKSLVSRLFFTSSLTLLACVLVGPIQTSQIVTVSSLPDCIRLSFALHPNQPTTRLGAAMATHAVLEEDALPYEIEEQERADALNDSRVSFLIPSSFRKVPDLQLIVPLSILTLYPLRC